MHLRAGGANGGVQPQKFQKCPRSAFLHADYQSGRQLSARYQTLLLQHLILGRVFRKYTARILRRRQLHVPRIYPAALRCFHDLRSIETLVQEVPRGHGDPRLLQSDPLRYAGQHVRMIDEEHPQVND